MCGSVRLKSGERVKVGGDLVAKIGGSWQRGPWMGWARQENLDTTWQDKLVYGYTQDVVEYEEKGHWFAVPLGCGLFVARLKTDFSKFPTGGLLVVTREAETPAEKAAHPRHPVVVQRPRAA